MSTSHPHTTYSKQDEFYHVHLQSCTSCGFQSDLERLAHGWICPVTGQACLPVCVVPGCCPRSAACADSAPPAERTLTCAAEPEMKKSAENKDLAADY